MWIALGIKRDIKKLNSKYFKNYKLPSILLMQCLQDIFTYLFTEMALVIVLDNVHLADHCSWKAIVNIVDITSKTLLVVTMEPMEELLRINANVHLEAHMEAVSGKIYL
jgi:predicted ATPase